MDNQFQTVLFAAIVALALADDAPAPTYGPAPVPVYGPPRVVVAEPVYPDVKKTIQ